jgi:tRNA(Ile)-lysidine synthase
LVDHYTAQAVTQCVNGNRLSLIELKTLLPLQQDLVIRQWLSSYQLNPEAQWLQTLKQQVIAARVDATPQLQLGDFQLRRFADKLYLLQPGDVMAPTDEVVWQGESEVFLPAHCGRLHFSAQPQTDAVALSVVGAQIMFGQLSARFKPADAAMSKPLKQWFKLWQVPPWQRLRVPLLFANGELVAVAGFASNTLTQHASVWCSWQR